MGDFASPEAGGDATPRRRNADEEATTEASLVPFNSELAQLDAQLKEKRGQIRHYKAAVVRNDEKIERLLEQVVNARS